MFWTNVLYNYFSWLFALSSCLPPPWPAWGWLVTPTMSQRSQHPPSSPQTTSPPTTSPPFCRPPTNFPPTKHIVSIPGWFAQHAGNSSSAIISIKSLFHSCDDDFFCAFNCPKCSTDSFCSSCNCRTSLGCARNCASCQQPAQDQPQQGIQYW